MYVHIDPFIKLNVVLVTKHIILDGKHQLVYTGVRTAYCIIIATF